MSTIIETNLITGKIVEREMTDDEKAQIITDKAEADALGKKLEAKKIAKQAVLDKLGLTVDEIAALFG